jgi:hypothetical protein
LRCLLRLFELSVVFDEIDGRVPALIGLQDGLSPLM